MKFKLKPLLIHTIKKCTLLMVGSALFIQNGYLLLQRKIHIGICIPFCIALIFLVIGFYWDTIQTNLQQYPNIKKLWFFLWGIFMIWLSSVIIFFIILQVNQQQINHLPKIQAILVLGSGVSQGQPTPILANRLNAAGILALQYPESILVLSGGFTTDPTQSEAEVMASYLIQHYDLPKHRLKLDSKSTSTSTNFKYSSIILNHLGLSKNIPIAVITSDFHTLRTKAIASKQGFQHVYIVGVSTPLKTRYQVWLREYFAYIHGKILQEF